MVLNKCMLIMLCVLVRNGNRSKTTGKSGKRVAASEADAVATKRRLFTCVVQQLSVSLILSAAVMCNLVLLLSCSQCFTFENSRRAENRSRRDI